MKMRSYHVICGSSIFTTRFLLVCGSQLEFVLWWCVMFVNQTHKWSCKPTKGTSYCTALQLIPSTAIRRRSDYIIGFVTSAIGPNKSKKLTRLIAAAHNIRGKVWIKDNIHGFTDNSCLWSHACCFSFKLCRVYCVPALLAVWVSRICLDRLLG